MAAETDAAWVLDDASTDVGVEDAVLAAAAGAALEPGMIYQFRAWSHGRGSHLSSTEDLRGVSWYQP